MSQKPFFSIITSTYNHEKFIGECLASVANQSFANWEQIVIDDGSCDHTWDIITDYAAKDSRIKPLRQDHQGPSKLARSYNLGLSRAQGEWIAILEGDDYWLPNKLKLQVDACLPSVIFTYGSYIDKINGKLLPGMRPPFTGKIPIEQFIPFLLLHKSFLIAVTEVIQKEALLSINGFHQDNSPAAVDMATMIHLLKLQGEVIYIPEPLGIWRHHSTQSTNLLAIELAQSNSRMALQFFDNLSETQQMALGIHRNEIVKARRSQIADAYFGVLRNKLRDREKENIQELIEGTWEFGGYKRKGQAIYSILANSLGCDLEFPLKFAEKISLTLKR